MSAHSSVIHQNALLHEKARLFLDSELAKAGHPDIKSRHGDLFAVLFEHDEVTLTELASLCERSKSTVSVMVDHLQRKGYVIKEKTRDQDARSVFVSLTVEGRKLQKIFNEISDKMHARLEGIFSEDELQLLEKMLKKAATKFS